MTLTLTEPEKAKKPKKAPRAKPVLDHDRLTRLANAIEDLRHSRLTDLREHLEAQEGLRLNDKGNALHVDLAGLQASSTAGLHDALSNWANAARRAVNEKGAA